MEFLWSSGSQFMPPAELLEMEGRSDERGMDNILVYKELLVELEEEV